MEFGLFIQGYVPGPAAHDTEQEHAALMNEADLIECADRHGWKYIWFSEHHALAEYSHMSASDVFMGYLARTGSLSEENIRRAMVVGATMGSYAVEQFGIRAFDHVTLADIAARMRAFTDLTHVSLAEALA